MNRFIQYLKNWYHFLHPSFQKVFLEYKVELKPRYGHGLPPHPELYRIINAQRDRYFHLLERCLGYADHLRAIRDSKLETDPTLPVWNSGYLPGLDIAGIYTIVSEFKPSQYIEVGSGTSTKVAHKARKEQGLAMKITSIDPSPRAEIDTIADVVVRKPFEKEDYSAIYRLQENDILFIDNSHRILPDSDSMVFFMEILPRLKPGVIVHVHDVYLPYDYPQEMCERIYNEQYGLAIWLLANPGRIEILLPGYFISEDDQLSDVLSPLWDCPELKNVERHGGSFWFRIKP